MSRCCKRHKSHQCVPALVTGVLQARVSVELCALIPRQQQQRRETQALPTTPCLAPFPPLTSPRFPKTHASATKSHSWHYSDCPSAPLLAQRAGQRVLLSFTISRTQFPSWKRMYTTFRKRASTSRENDYKLGLKTQVRTLSNQVCKGTPVSTPPSLGRTLPVLPHWRDGCRNRN